MAKLRSASQSFLPVVRSVIEKVVASSFHWATIKVPSASLSKIRSMTVTPSIENESSPSAKAASSAAPWLRRCPTASYKASRASPYCLAAHARRPSVSSAEGASASTSHFDLRSGNSQVSGLARRRIVSMRLAGLSSRRPVSAAITKSVSWAPLNGIMWIERRNRDWGETPAFQVAIKSRFLVKCQVKARSRHNCRF